ncbi:trypsin-3-like [Diorhabda carinulata]|uniref:trypsin-3-like n=1 Tax=Diorhabda carinulata TaxID=1163345 RepID=UPI0025A2DD92|nr:trypsin-3-like [Diorhabda carinulata]
MADREPTENQYEGKIVGGAITDTTIYPYQLSLQYLGIHVCGASLIGRKWVLTAAHCVYDIFTNFLSIRAGAVAKQRGGEVIDVVKKYIHPLFNNDTLDYDIALLELNEDVDPDYGEIIPIANEGDTMNEGDMGTVVGWGATVENGPMSKELIVTEVPVIAHKKCENIMGTMLTSRMFCAGYLIGRRDACRGDSGGPFIINGVQIGIISWGIGCGRLLIPGVYASIPVLRKYIRSISGI